MAGLLATWVVAACQHAPSWVDPVVPPAAETVLERYRVEQLTRKQGPHHWSVEGVLELETPDQGRRNRIDLLGSGWEQVRMRVFGPFRQVAAELLTRGKRVRWVDPDHRAVTEVPATAVGMDYLMGVPIHPERFFQVIMARAGELAAPSAAFDPNGRRVRVRSRDGEQLWLDPTWGRIVERASDPENLAPYRVVYGWPEAQPDTSEVPLMPERVVVTLEKPKVRLEFGLHRWRFPAAGPGDQLFDQAVKSGFAVSRPLGAGS
ncbi:MAG: hypothetical protein G8237_15395 [Magnetococcales bacterium]|nr:hypothetical protein [Magnetococcales bacterium]